MKVHSVSVSLPKDVSHEGKTITTSIFKEPVPGRVIVRRLNIDGDDQVESGARLCVKSPSGEFHLDPQDDSPVVLLSGGVGLTPMISMLNAIVEAGSQRPVWFIHGARNGRDSESRDR